MDKQMLLIISISLVKLKKNLININIIETLKKDRESRSF